MKQNEILNYLHTCSNMLFALSAWTGAFQAPELNPGQHGAKVLFSLGLTSKSISFCTAPVPWMLGVSCGAGLMAALSTDRELGQVGTSLAGSATCTHGIIHSPRESILSLVQKQLHQKLCCAAHSECKSQNYRAKALKSEETKPGSLQNRCKRGKCSS